MTARDLHILHAIADGRGVIVCGCGDVLLIDGLACSDQSASLRLMWSGLVARGCDGEFGDRVPAVLTPAGAAVAGGTVVAA